MTLVDPVVVEALTDAVWSGQSFRHSLTFRRGRPELDPADKLNLLALASLNAGNAAGSLKLGQDASRCCHCESGD